MVLREVSARSGLGPEFADVLEQVALCLSPGPLENSSGQKCPLGVLFSGKWLATKKYPSPRELEETFSRLL